MILQLTLYDTAGMERFEGTIPPTYFRAAKAVIFVYSVTEPDSINDIESWMDSVSPQRMEYMGNKPAEIIRFLVGNKIDLEGELERTVDTDRGAQVAENCEIERSHFFEISALNGDGFEEMFENIVREIWKGEESKPSATVSLSSNGGGGSGSGGSGCVCMKK